MAKKYSQEDAVAAVQAERDRIGAVMERTIADGAWADKVCRAYEASGLAGATAVLRELLAAFEAFVAKGAA